MDRTFKEDQKANAVNISFIIITLVVLCWNLTAVSIAATKTEQNSSYWIIVEYFYEAIGYPLLTLSKEALAIHYSFSSVLFGLLTSLVFFIAKVILHYNENLFSEGTVLGISSFCTVLQLIVTVHILF